MRAESQGFLVKAERALRAGQILLREADAESAVGRAYYAMLHTAQALLREKDLRYRKHSGVHSPFGEHFVKTGNMDPKFHRWILAAFNNRLKGDYDFDAAIDSETAALTLEHAGEFLREAKHYLQTATPPESAD
jgi:uncharacterized protein (UPF0332 family)